MNTSLRARFRSVALFFGFWLLSGLAAWSAPTVTVQATIPETSEVSPAKSAIYAPGIFRIARTGLTNDQTILTVALSGTASNGIDYVSIPSTITIPAGASSIDVYVVPFDDALVEGTESVELTLVPSPCLECYIVGPEASATVYIRDNEPTNNPPRIAIFNPTNNETFTAPAVILLQATASDVEDGDLLHVDFWAGTNRIGTAGFNPTLCPQNCPYYSLTWSNVPPGRHVITARARDRAGAVAISGPVEITVTNRLPEPTIITLVTRDPEASEMSPLVPAFNNGQFELLRRGNLASSIPVYFTLSGTASNGTDYRMITNPVVIPAGATQAFVNVIPLSDTAIEGTDTVILTLETPICVAIAPTPPECYQIHGTNRGVVLIRDAVSSNAPPVVRVFASDPTARESSGGSNDVGRFTFTRTGPITNALPVYFSLGGTASNRADYVIGTNMILIPPGSSNAHLIVAAIDDSTPEPTETIALALLHPPLNSSVQPYTIGSPSNAVVSIEDNDILPPQVTNFTLVATGSVWKYLDSGSDAGTAWREPGFDDTAWARGAAQLGFGDGDEATVIRGGVSAPETNRYITAYFRNRFPVTNAAAISNLTLSLLRDDGAIVYLNGVEVFRSNMPDGPVNYLTLAPSPSEEPGDFHRIEISSSLLVNGLNVIAVEVHQSALASSDLSFDLSLVGNRATQPAEQTVVTVVATDAEGREPGILTVIDHGQFAIRRSGNLGVAIPVQFTLSGTASNGIDYHFITNRVVIPAGSTQAVVNVVPLMDNLLESNEVVTLRLQLPPCFEVMPRPPECYVIGAQGQASVVIVDGTPVVTNRPPVASWLTPMNGATFTEGMSPLLRATAHDPDGSLQRVEFRSTSGLLGLGLASGSTNFSYTWSNAPVGTHTLFAVAVDQGNARGTSAPVTVTVRSQPVVTNRELHVVSIYSGLFNGGSSPNHERGDAAVIVDRPGSTVTLYLSGHEPVLWNVSATPGTVLERVFLAGYHQQDITNLPSGTALVRNATEIGFDLNCASFYLNVPAVKTATGLEISSFQGSYVALAPFLVNGVQNDPRLHSTYPQATPGAVPPLSFRLPFHQRGSADGTVTYVDYTSAGLLSGHDLLPGMRVFPDSGGRYFYGVESHEVWTIDTHANTSSQMSLPSGLPGWSWAWSGAFDQLRNRFLVVSFGGEGYLYSYSPSNQHWSVLRSMDNVDLSAIVYHGFTDELFGLSRTFTECDRPTLYRMDANGAVLETKTLPIIPFGRYGMRVQMVSVEHYIVLLMEAEGSYNDPVESRIYVYDPRTGQLTLTARIVPRPDADNDGVPDDRDRCAGTTPGAAVDANGCSATQRDSDNDGIIDSLDTCPNTPAGEPVNGAGCSASQRDSDADGVTDNRDLCPGTPRGVVVNSNGCPVVPPDSDGDGVADNLDQCPNTSPGTIVNEHGCSIAQLCPCDGPWRNHNEYVRCVEGSAQLFLEAGRITAAQRDEIVARARASDCGFRNPRLTVPVQRPETVQTNGCRLVLEGDGPVTCIIERSVDLLEWIPISTNVVNGATIELIDRDACNAARRFYRLRLQ